MTLPAFLFYVKFNEPPYCRPVDVRSEARWKAMLSWVHHRVVYSEPIEYPDYTWS